MFHSVFLAMVSPQLLLIAVLVPIAVAVGFTCGLLYERWYHSQRLQRLSNRFEKLYEYATGVLTQAEQVCERLQSAQAQQQLTPPQRSRLTSLSSRLIRQLGQLTGVTGENEPSAAQKTRVSTVSGRRFSFQFPPHQAVSRDERTGLPDALTYQSQLQTLLVALKGTEVHCGALFVQVDQYARLGQRSGQATADEFVRQIGSLVLRQTRDSDQLFQISEELLIGLFPNILREEMERIAQAARRAVRNHHFLNPDNKEPVFVTASFSYGLFQADLAEMPDPEKELWLLGQQALQASQKHGRCQLHEITASGTSRMIAG